MNNKKKSNEVYNTKDSPSRSITKAISWRVIATLTTFLITFIIFQRYTEKSLTETFETASFVAGIEIIAKIFFYYLHERMWQNIKWGKDWRRDYWQRRAWKKMYRKMHS
jgi:uncharacterized membrane protein